MNDSVEVFEGEPVKAAVLPVTLADALFWVLTVALLRYAAPEKLEIVTIGSPRSVALWKSHLRLPFMYYRMRNRNSATNSRGDNAEA